MPKDQRQNPNTKSPMPKPGTQRAKKNYKFVDAQNIVTFRALPCEYQADQALEPSQMNKQQEAA